MRVTNIAIGSGIITALLSIISGGAVSAARTPIVHAEVRTEPLMKLPPLERAALTALESHSPLPLLAPTLVPYATRSLVQASATGYTIEWYTSMANQAIPKLAMYSTKPFYNWPIAGAADLGGWDYQWFRTAAEANHIMVKNNAFRLTGVPVKLVNGVTAHMNMKTGIVAWIQGGWHLSAQDGNIPTRAAMLALANGLVKSLKGPFPKATHPGYVSVFTGGISFGTGVTWQVGNQVLDVGSTGDPNTILAEARSVTRARL